MDGNLKNKYNCGRLLDVDGVFGDGNLKLWMVAQGITVLEYSNTLLVTPNGFTKGGTLVTFVTPTTRRHFIVDQNLNPIQPGGGAESAPYYLFSITFESY